MSTSTTDRSGILSRSSQHKNWPKVKQRAVEAFGHAVFYSPVVALVAYVLHAVFLLY